jgi:anti-sigma B factor antagonist
MPDAAFPVSMVKGVPVVAAPEQIDITSADGLRAALLDFATRGKGTLVVDMTRTQFCDTSALHALVGARKRAQADGGDVLLVITGAAVLRIFAITGLDRIFASFTSLDEALAQAHAATGGEPRGTPHQALPSLRTSRRQMIPRPGTTSPDPDGGARKSTGG